MAPNAESSGCQPGVCAPDVPKESFRCMESERSVWGQTFGIKKKKKKKPLSLSLAYTENIAQWLEAQNL